MIKPSEASRILGVSVVTLSQSKKYARFYKRASDGKNNAWFDIEKYNEYIATDNNIKSQTGMLIEFMLHEIGMTIDQIASFGISRTGIATHTFSPESCKQFISTVFVNRPDVMRRYCEYYR